MKRCLRNGFGHGLRPIPPKDGEDFRDHETKDPEVIVLQLLES
jgi:hypothetical protein